MLDLDLDIARVADTDMCGTYIFEARHLPKDNHMRNAVFFAREQLLQSAILKGCNVLLLERCALELAYYCNDPFANTCNYSWTCTLYRRGKHHRVEVRYSGRPAHALGKVPRRSPPFIRVLEGRHPSL